MRRRYPWLLLLLLLAAAASALLLGRGGPAWREAGIVDRSEETTPPVGALRREDVEEVEDVDRAARAHARLVGREPAPRRVRPPEVRDAAEAGLPLKVRLVEAETGREIRVEDVVASLGPGPARAERTADGTFLVHPAVGTPLTVGLKVAPPRGRLAWDKSRTRTAISPYAKELVYVYPLRRERTALVTVDEADGSPAAAHLRPAWAAGRELVASCIHGDAYDRFRVTGIPHLPGETLRVRATTAEPDFVGAATAVVAIPDDPREDILVRVKLPRLVHVSTTLPVWNSAISMGGGAGGAFGGRLGRHVTLNTAGAVSVTVRRRNGEPAVNAIVRVGGRSTRTDASGRAHLGGVMPGTHVLEVVQVGMLPTSGRVEVKRGATVHVELEEPAGGSLEVEVVDDAGRPLPFARLEIENPSGRTWVDLQGDTQRLDPFCDHCGRRRYEAVEPGRLRVKARWGSRVKEVRVEPAETGPRTVRIVLPRPTR